MNTLGSFCYCVEIIEYQCRPIVWFSKVDIDIFSYSKLKLGPQLSITNSDMNTSDMALCLDLRNNMFSFCFGSDPVFSQDLEELKTVFSQIG